MYPNNARIRKLTNISNPNSATNGRKFIPKSQTAKQGGLRGLSAHDVKTMSALISRAELASRAGLRFDGERDYYKVFGYKRRLDYKDYLGKYVRQDIASRIIDAPPGATWSNPPAFSDPALQEAWDKLDNKHSMWSKLQRADRLARLGNFSLLMFGFSGSKLDQALTNTRGQELLFVRPLSMNSVGRIEIEVDSTSAQFGRPAKYRLKTFDSSTRSGIERSLDTIVSTTDTAIASRKVDVDPSKVVHIVENPLEDDIIGIPIIERAFNLLDDLLKVAGGTAETFWLAGNRGMQIDLDKDMDLNPDDEKNLTDEVDEYVHGLRRFMRTRGVTVNNLGSDTPNPMETFNMIISLLSGVSGIPRRILIGTEVGQLASEQDRANWAERIEERSLLYAEPHILRPTVQLLQNGGVLPQVEIDITWPTAFRLSPLERSQVSAQSARAVGNMSRQTGNQTPMQITSRKEAREIVNLEGDLPKSEILFTNEDDDETTIQS